MKRNILLGIVLLGAFALSSCSTQQLAANKAGKDDDVYFSEAKAGDAPVYVAAPQQPQQNRYNNYNDDDYYYYDSYASRINRFGYYSPFGYYNDIYAGYYPYYGMGSRFSYGVGLGWGWGGYGFNNPYYYGYYDPFFYGGYYGYNPYWGYNSIGIGYGYGYGGGYWGGYSTYGSIANNGTPRPYRGSGAPANAMVNRFTNNIGYNGNYPMNNAYPGRPQIGGNTAGGRQAVNSYGSQQQNAGARPTRGEAPRPSYNPPAVQSSPPPSSGGYSGGGSSGGGGGGGGGGARPVRP